MAKKEHSKETAQKPDLHSIDVADSSANKNEDEHTAKSENDTAVSEVDQNEVSDSMVVEQHHTADDKQFRFSKLRVKLLHPKKLAIVGIIMAILAVGVGTAYAMPVSRYVLLNSLSNADATIHIINSKTKLPIAGAKVTLASGESVDTDASGKAFFNDTDFGKTTITVEKANYQSSSFDAVISKDNIDLGQKELTPNGVPINIEAEDWLSGNKLVNFSVTTQNDASTKVDAVEGKLSLSIPYEAEEVLLTINADGYNENQVTLKMTGPEVKREPVGSEDVTVVHPKMVLAGEHYFVSNRDGDVNFYASSFDGAHIEKIVATNQKTDYLEHYPVAGTDLYAVLLSSTGKTHNGRQDQLAIVDIKQKTLKVVDEAPGQKLDFNMIDVGKKSIVYQVAYDAERADKYKIKTYNLETGKLTTHYSSSTYSWPVYDKDRDAIYIVQQNGEYTGIPGSPFKIIRIDLGSSKQTALFERQAVSYVSIDQSKPGKLLVSVYDQYFNTIESGYYLVDLADNSKTEFIGRDYPDYEQPDEVPDSEKGQSSPSNLHRIWVDNRDNKGRLILDETTNVVGGQVGELNVQSIIRWVNDSYVTIKAYNGSETADYIVDTKSGNIHKITETLATGYYEGY